jgi:hypothetical protein
MPRRGCQVSVGAVGALGWMRLLGTAAITGPGG